MKQTDFTKGVKDSIPVSLGYLSVSFGIGIAAASADISPMCATLLSLTNVTSAGEAAGISIIAAGGNYIETALSQLIINLRYSLMSISLSQKMDKSFTTFHRLAVSFAITDEIYALAAGKNGNVNRSYMYGLIVLPIIFWTLGTFFGALSGQLMPKSVCDALGIMLYSMFIAIVIPGAINNKGIRFAAVCGAVISVMIYYLPFLGFISSGFSVIIAGCISAALCAVLFPVYLPDDEEIT